MRLLHTVPLALLAIGCAQANTSGVDAATVDAAQDERFDLASAPDLAISTLICAGETYDANGMVSDGCEVTDAPLNNHAQTTAVNLGSFSCDDSSSAQHITGIVPADGRVHDPVVPDFSMATGSAPDWFHIYATGGVCDDDLTLNLAVTGSVMPSCYLLTANTSEGTYTCQSDSVGNCAFANGTGSYDDDSDIYIYISKTCPGNDKASYTITGHL